MVVILIHVNGKAAMPVVKVTSSIGKENIDLYDTLLDV
jgi:hypothetical protein